MVIFSETVLEKFDPMPSETAFLAFFLPEVASGVIFGVAVD